MDRINGINIGNLNLERTDSVRGGDAVQPSGHDAESSREDAIALSAAAREVGRFSELVSQAREERVAKIRELLEAGAYSVPAEDVARKMIDCHLNS